MYTNEAQDIRALEARSQRRGYEQSFRTWLGSGGQLGRSGLVQVGVPREQRALSVLSGPAGAFLLPAAIEGEFIKAADNLSVVKAIARNITTPSGITMQWPVVDDTTNRLTVTNENAATSEPTNPVFNAVLSETHNLRSGLLPVSLELFEDSAAPLGEILGSLLGDRLYRGFDYYATVGSGADEPTGVCTPGALTVGKAGNTGSVASVTFGELQDLEASISGRYRWNTDGTPKARYLMAESTLTAIRKLVDGNGRPIVGVDSQNRQTINGFPVTLSDFAPAMAASACSIVFGSFEEGVITRQVAGLALQMLREHLMVSGQVGLQVWLRAGTILPAKLTGALKIYQHAAS